MRFEEMGKEDNHLFGYIPASDLQWLYENTTCPITKVWALGWLTDPFGDKFVKLPTPNISESAFRKSRRILRDAEKFEFEIKKNSKDPRKTEYWNVKNTRGKKSTTNATYNTHTKNGRRSKQYREFLKSDYWQDVRNKVLTRDNHTCQKCNSVRSLQVHHLSYLHHRDELNHLEDLITVCRECHRKLHHR